MKKWLGVLALGMVLSIQGCKKELESIKTLSGKYESIGIVETSVDTTFSNWDEKLGLIPKFPSDPGDRTLSEEERQFLEATGKEVVDEVVKNPIFKVVGDLVSKEQNDRMVVYGQPFGGVLSPEQAIDLCEKYHVDGVATVQFSYFLWDEPYWFKGYVDFGANLKSIATLKFETRGNSGGLMATIHVYDKTGKKVFSTQGKTWTHRVKSFVIVGHTFHLTNRTQPVLEEAKQNMIVRVKAFSESGK